MANITEVEEFQIRKDIKAYFETLGLNMPIFHRRIYIASANELLEKMTTKNIDGKSEIRYCFIEWLRFQDDPFQGLGDCPATEFVYRVHVFVQYSDTRSDETDSEQDFVGAILKIRNGILTKDNFSYMAKPTAAEDLDPALFGRDDGIEADGHSKDLLFSVRINPANI